MSCLYKTCSGHVLSPLSLIDAVLLYVMTDWLMIDANDTVQELRFAQEEINRTKMDLMAQIQVNL